MELQGWQQGIGLRLPWLGSEVSAQPLQQPRWLGWSESVAQQLGLKPDEQLLQLFSGHNQLPWAGFAQVYSGHQFGGYTPQLGDGRGMLLGMRNGYELFAKGSGITPYSRGGDGRAVLRSAVREFLASEALHHLGIATSRALAVVGSSTPVYREEVETGAITIRVTSSHLRFGHFEYFYYTGQQQQLEALLQDCIEQQFSHLKDAPDARAQWLAEVVKRTATTVADWQAFGFCHGVLNSDNMSILGETFDYGPFAFLNQFNSGYVCNHSDHSGRYAFDQQPGVAMWNLTKLATALSGLIPAEQLEAALASYEPALVQRYLERMGARLGLVEPTPADLGLLADLLSQLQSQQADYHLTLRQFSQLDPNAERCPLLGGDEMQLWWQQYQQRIGVITDVDGWQQQRAAANPVIILRTHLAQAAIEAAELGDNGPLERLHLALTRPYDPQPQDHIYCQEAPAWSQTLTLSCSS
ncbi:protein adenylyltransferase SelO [Ferrimonas lipolytica]|uniref:Protein nucleotidyltransferase YdiU n=1 Tax=Ferrimonas lipolytica TaxID=2724191 RepID=A0A6H1UG81_9GAMM|nr:YdiU family protein [Ferrimonas lipolytica]QIZ78091.1 YdiU family protein [Ferrimonas lipolytica]